MSKLSWLAPSHPAQLAIGFVIWSFWFVAIYGGLSVACQLVPPEPEQGPYNGLNGSLLVLTLLVTALLLFLAWRSGRYCLAGRKASKEAAGFEGFIGYVGTVLHLVAAIATLAVGLPVLVMPPCI